MKRKLDWRDRRFLSDRLPILLLILFQLLFVGCALLQTTDAHYRPYHKAENGRWYYTTEASPILRQLVISVVLLILAMLLICRLFRWLQMSPAPVVVPLFALLTISVVYQSYISSPANSARHVVSILMGLAAMVAAMFFTRLLWEAGVSDPLYRGLLYLCCGLSVLSIPFGTFARIGSFNLQPGEFFKLLTILLTGVGFPKVCEDKNTRTLLGVTIGLECLALFAVMDLGNILILLGVVLVVVYVVYGARWAAFWTAMTGVLAAAGFQAVKALGIGLNAVWRVEDTFHALTDPMPGRVNKDHRVALLAALKNGIFGGGLRDNTYILNNKYIYTDFVFDGILCFFGVGIGLLTVGCFVYLIWQCRARLDQAGQDISFYLFTNTMMMILGLQALIHIGGNLNVLPFTGVVLPFLSRGGTATLTAFLELGIALGGRIPNERIERTSRWTTGAVRWLEARVDGPVQQLENQVGRGWRRVQTGIAAKRQEREADR